MQKVIISLLLTSVIFLSSCAPSLRNGISVNAIPEEKVAELRPLANSRVSINVQPFRDGRENRWIARVNEGRQVGPEGDIGLAVQGAFQRQLSLSGVKLSPINAFTIDGTVTEWQMVVNVGFPASRADAFATIELNLFDAQKRSLLSGTYKGSSSMEHPFIEDKLENILGEAMGFAVHEALSDPKLVAALNG